MKTKKFLLATAGSTVDGRTIDDKMLQEAADSYDPKTYTARVNIEHIRGISGDKPFRAYGDVLEASTEQVTVNFNGKAEQRLGLFGVLDVTDDAKALNDANQKVFPSIELEPNFGGKGFAYLMGCALTDSPAAIGTERLQFNRAAPGVIQLTAEHSGIAAAAIEIAAVDQANDESTNAIANFAATVLGKLGFSANTQTEPKQTVTTPEPKADDKPSFDPAAFATAMGETLAAALTKQSDAFTAQLAEVTSTVTALSQKIDTTADPNHRTRPPANGQNGNFTRTDC